MTDTTLEVRDLAVGFARGRKTVAAVSGVSFDVRPGECLGIVGESGSGKSVSTRAILGMLRENRRAQVAGRVVFRGADLFKASASRLRKVRGKDIGYIPQDPTVSLNPVLTVGRQLCQTISAHRKIARAEVRAEAIRLLGVVEIANAEKRFEQYPHELSGGMKQRVSIAMAIAHSPSLLIADEPTTALDVTTQAQIMDVLRNAQRHTHSSLILITHDMGLIAEMADRVLVMYAGKLVEQAGVREIFDRPAHPYTVGLLSSVPDYVPRGARLRPIPGAPPDPSARSAGCPFQPRCALSAGRGLCKERDPEPEPVDGSTDHLSACHFLSELPDFRAATLRSKEPEES